MNTRGLSKVNLNYKGLTQIYGWGQVCTLTHKHTSIDITTDTITDLSIFKEQAVLKIC